MSKESNDEILSLAKRIITLSTEQDAKVEAYKLSKANKKCLISLQDLYTAIKRIDEGHLGSAKNFIRRYINCVEEDESIKIKATLQK